MIKTKQRKLVLISTLLAVVLFSACEANGQLNGRWQVESMAIAVTDNAKYLQESEPGFLENKLRNQFPKGLEEGDVLDLSINNMVIVNEVDTFSYKSSHNSLHIRHADIIYSLLFESDVNSLVLKRSLHQGEIEWRLERTE